MPWFHEIDEAAKAHGAMLHEMLGLPRMPVPWWSQELMLQRQRAEQRSYELNPERNKQKKR